MNDSESYWELVLNEMRLHKILYLARQFMNISCCLKEALFSFSFSSKAFHGTVLILEHSPSESLISGISVANALEIDVSITLV